MTILVLGLLLWSVVHLFPAVAPHRRKSLVVRLGLPLYKGGFAMLIILSIVLMVTGWRTTVPEHIYILPYWVRYLTLLLVYIGMLLFVAAQLPTNIKRFLRHPQLSGLVFWGTGHVLVNGDSRSLVLFLGLVIWAKIQIIMTNRRDGKAERSAPVSIRYDMMVVGGGTLLYGLLVLIHPYISGVPLF